MNKYISSVIITVIGATIGCGVTNFILRRNYLDTVQEYSDSLYLSRTKVEKVPHKKYEETELVDPADSEHPLDGDEDIIIEDPTKKERRVSSRGPEIIDDYEYREECLVFNKRQLILYQDLALVDEDEELIYPESVFGDITQEVTDMFSLDTVYVRDSRISTDYEVIKSAKIYSEMDQ